MQLIKDQLLKILIFSALGWCFAVISDLTEIGTLISLCTTFYLGKWFWFNIDKRDQSVRLLRTGMFFLVFLQNLMWIVAFITNKFVLNTSIHNTINNSMKGGLTIQYYFLAILYITFFSIMCIIFSNNNKVVLMEKKLYKKINNVVIKKNTSLKIVFAISSINVILITTGIIGQRTLIIDGYDKGIIPFWFPIFQSLQPLLLFQTILIISTWKNYKSIPKYEIIVSIISLISIVIIFFSSGRRGFIFISIVGFCLYIFLMKTKPSFYKIIIISIISYPIISYMLLINSYSRYNKGDIISSLIDANTQFSSRGTDINEIKLSNTQNYASRPLVATPLAYCLMHNTPSFTYGENLLNSIIQAIPRNSIFDKKNYPTQEELLFKHFRIGKTIQEDTADSIYLYSYTEFGLIGLLLYPILIMLFWTTIMKAILSVNYLLATLLYSGTLLFFLSDIGEGSITSWILQLRTALFIYIVYLIYKTFRKNNAHIVHR